MGLVCRMGAAVLLALALLPALSEARSAPRNRYSLKVFQSATPPGSASVMLGLADNGVGVGQVLFANGTSHPLLWNGRRLFDRASLIGDDSTFTATDVLGYQVGSRKVNGVDFPFALVGTTRIDLPRPGRALSAAPGGLVAVQGTGSDGLAHVLLWQVADGSVRDFGPGLVSAVNAFGVLVGRTVNGNAAWWGADGTMHDLGFAGRLLRVNIGNLASGYELVGGGPKPITFDLNRGRLTRLQLPRGWPFGSAKVLTDAGQVAGDLVKHPQGGPPSEGVVWRGRRVVRGARLLGFRLPRGNKLADISAMTNAGLIAGSLSRPRSPLRSAGGPAQEQAFIGEPETWYKLESLRNLVLRRASQLEKFYLRAGFLGIAEDLATMSDLLKLGRTPAVCRDVDQIADELITVYQVQALVTSSEADVAVYNELVRGLEDFIREESCRRFNRTINLPAPLYPVPGAAPIPMTQERPVTQERIGTGRETVRCACEEMKAYISDLAIRQVGSQKHPGDSTRLEMKVNVQITCTNGEGGCLGTMELRPPAGATFLRGPNLGEERESLFFWCESKCATSTIIRRNLTWVALEKRGRRTVPNPKFTPGGRANRTIGLSYTTSCRGLHADESTERTGEFGIHFDRLGQVDYRNSDLDDNNVLDGGKLTDAQVFG